MPHIWHHPSSLVTKGIFGRASRKQPILVVLVIGLLMATGVGAARLGPPSVYLSKEPHIVAVVEAHEKTEDGRVVFKRLEILMGDRQVEDRLVVRMADESVNEVKAGARYILGFTTLRPVARHRGLFEPDPNGPSAVRIPGLGDALLDNTSEIRRIILASAEEEPDLRKLLDAVLVQLARRSTNSLRFVTAELLLRPELQQRISPKDLAVVRKRLRSLAHDPFSRDLLLQAAGTLTERLGGGWLADECRNALGGYGTELDLSSPVPALLVTAARYLGANGAASDHLLLEKHLLSNNPGVTKAVLRAMDALDPKATEKAVRNALETNNLHPESRRALEVHLLKIEKRTAEEPASS
jgi:hypothetical protein